MKGIQFESIQEFIHHFERLFGKKVDHLELSYKIGTIYQIPNESVLSYQLRLENLLDRTKKAYEASISNAENGRELINHFNAQINAIAKTRFRIGFLPEIECRLNIDDDTQLSIGDIAIKATRIEDYLEKFKEMRQEIQPIFKNDTKTASIKTLNQENCEKCLSTDHKKQHCPENINEKFEKLENMVQNLCEQVGKTVLAIQPKNTQTQENSEKRQKLCRNHPNSITSNTNECNKGNFRGNSSQKNQRNFQSNNYSNNTRIQNRCFGINPNNKNNYNSNNGSYNNNRTYYNNRQSYNRQNNGQNNYQNRNNGY